MRVTLFRKLRLVAFLSLPALGCGDGEGSADPAPRASVTFVYDAAVDVDPQVADVFPGCVAGVGHTHIHPSWRGFDRVDMSAEGGRWTITFMDVPVDSRERIRVSDRNACADNPTGAATRNVFANGILLTEIVDTPGSGTEPGLALTVAADGTVTP